MRKSRYRFLPSIDRTSLTMAFSRPRVTIAVTIIYEEDLQTINCDHLTTIAQVRERWQNVAKCPISVAFFSGDRCLSDEVTVGEALPKSSSRSLELHAVMKSKYWLQVLGFEDSNTLFEVAATLPPAAVRRDIERAVDIHIDDFRLTLDGAELDQELPFNEQGLTEGAQLMVDLRVVANIHFTDSDESRRIECFGSDSIGDLRKKLSFANDMALVATSPYRRVLTNTLRVCHVVDDLLKLQMPVDLIAEPQVMLSFEPITLEHLRQQLPVFLSYAPLDIYHLVSERFELKTEFRLAVNGQKLDIYEPLGSQLIDVEDVIQVDILRPFVISDLWEPPQDLDSLEEVYLYSTESSCALYLLDEINNQRIYHDDINLTIFGSVIDVVGPISGQEKPVVLVDRDVERECPMLTFDGVMRKLVWARDMLVDVVPMSRGLPPKEIMRSGELLPSKSLLGELRLTEDTLTITDPEKVFIAFDKKLRMCRFAHGATYGDVRARMQQQKGSLDIGLKTFDWQIPDTAMDRKVDREILYLTSASRFQTKLTVTVNGQWYGCWYESQQVSFSDVMVSVGKKAKVMPRHLFSKSLYCCGCGRQLSKKEEPHQAIPDTCCSVKSLQLTDRPVKDVGIQTPGARRRDAETYTLDPECRDVCVGPESVRRTAIVSSTPVQMTAATAHPPPSPPTTLRIDVQSPENKAEVKLVTFEGGSGGDLLAAAQRHFAEFRVDDSAVVYLKERIFDQNGEERRGVDCYREGGGFSYIDPQNGEDVGVTFQLSSFRFLRPSSPFPYPGLHPRIFIRSEAKIVTTTPRGQLKAAPADALTDASFMLLLRGFRCGAEVFWATDALCDFFINAKSGEVFDILNITGGPKSFLFAALRNNSLVPRAKIPKHKTLCVWRRPGCDVRVEGGRVRCSGCVRPDDVGLWDYPYGYDDLEESVTAAVRKA